MGAQASNNQSTQTPVYYDTETNQYYTNNSLAGMNLLAQMMGNNMGIPSRNYLNNPYPTSTFSDRFTPKNIPAQYPEMNMLFPALNTGLLQGIASSTQPDGAMLGAGRFLSPRTINT